MSLATFLPLLTQECREAKEFLLRHMGSTYDVRLAPWRAMIRARAASDRVSLLKATATLTGIAHHRDPLSMHCLSAAYIDLTTADPVQQQ